MNNSIRSILRSLEQFKKTEESTALDLRLSLADIILQRLREDGWSQARLAREAGLKEPYISRVLHSDANCTLSTAAKLFFALGVRARFQVTGTHGTHKTTTESTLNFVDFSRHGRTYEQGIFTAQAETQVL